jgi:hypothetical protein
MSALVLGVATADAAAIGGAVAIFTLVAVGLSWSLPWERLALIPWLHCGPSNGATLSEGGRPQAYESTARRPLTAWPMLVQPGDHAFTLRRWRLAPARSMRECQRLKSRLVIRC